MKTTLTVDKAGRIVLPKSVRSQLQLGPGDSLELQASGEEITLKPLRGTAQVRKKRGVWVFRCGEPLSVEAVNQTIERVRRERDEANLGKVR